MTKCLACLVTVCLSLVESEPGGSLQDPQHEPVHQVLVSFEDLDYPPLPRAVNQQGVVVVDVRLDDGGVPVSASALTGPELLIPHATANATKWRFRPNRQARAIIVYDFSIDSGACHDRSRSLFLLKHPNFAQIKSCSNVIEGRP